MKKYNVIIVDDEPAAINFIAKIIEWKCPQLEVVATANSGLEALTLLHAQHVDIVFTDIKMPEMDGVELVTTISRDFPYICSIVVSGHQDFDYVKETLQAGVVDYLLKPISPTDVINLCKSICAKLDNMYHTRRNILLRNLSNGDDNIDMSELKQLFRAQKYYAAIIRKNVLISRFNTSARNEIFSSKNNLMTIYGRDDMEMLFIYSEEAVIIDFGEIMQREYEKTKSDESFLTMVINKNAFQLTNFSKVVRNLYQTLDTSIVIGLEQIIYLDESTFDKSESSHSSEHFQYLLYLIEKNEYDRLTLQLKVMFDIWAQEQLPQIEIENKLKYFFHHAKVNGLLNEWNEYWLDDAFSDALTMRELCNNITELLSLNIETPPLTNKTKRENIFQDVISYTKKNLNGDLSIQRVCSEVNVSQATLNRLFRTFAEMPYKNYLTKLRIETAQSMMKQNPNIYIKDIAAYVGFRDQFYFSRVFRSITGLSPSDYLEQLDVNSE